MSKYVYSRRAFLAQLGLVTAGGVLAACAGPAAPAGGPAAEEGGVAVPGAAADEVAPGIPRAETLILEDPSGRNTPPDNFNRWGPGQLTQSTASSSWHWTPVVHRRMKASTACGITLWPRSPSTTRTSRR